MRRQLFMWMSLLSTLIFWPFVDAKEAAENLNYDQRILALYANGDHALHFTYLLGIADAYALSPPLTVVGNQPLPSSQHPNDYFSVGPYWWPDPNKEDGLPWIRRDGNVNRAVRGPLTDSRLFYALSNRIQVLVLANQVKPSREYKRAINTLIQTWFVNADTAMTPHLNYAQAIPGRTSGRGIGIIEIRHLVTILHALEQDNTLLDEQTKYAFEEWLATFLRWLLESKNGQDEAKTRNNHGTYYDTIVAKLAAYLGKKDIAIKAFEQTASRAISQIDSEGKQKHELERTRPFHYSLFNVDAFVIQMRTAKNMGYDFASKHTNSVARIRAALKLLISDYAESSLWPGPMEPELPITRLVATGVLAKSLGFADLAGLVESTLLPNSPDAWLQWQQCHLWLYADASFVQQSNKQTTLCDYLH